MRDHVHQQILESQLKLYQLEYQNWRQDSLFHWHWWLMITLILASWLVWWKLVDKRLLSWIMIYGLLLALSNCLVDVNLVNLGLYAYPHRTLYTWPGLIFGELSIAPVTFMLIYQNSPKWRDFIIHSTMAAAVLAFVGEPILYNAIKYELYHWSYYHSFVLYILIVAVPKLVLDLLMKAVETNKG
ncbi:MAG: CBO0543 family protein [Candidatus Saccharibacteria bacterium]